MNPVGKSPLSNSAKAALGTQLAGNALTTLASAPERISNLIRHRYPTVAVTGMSGVGKTRLVDRLAGHTSADITTSLGSATMERRTSKSARLKGFRFRVVPGDNAASRLHALDEVFHEDPVDGIIHVVSYGHATPRAGSVLAAQPQAASTQEQLQAELEDWIVTSHRIAAMAVRRERPIWLVIAVTKADLYPQQIDEAVRYYSPGSGSPFAKKLDELRALAGGAKVAIDVLPVSAEEHAELDTFRATLEARMAHLSGHI